LPVVVSSDKNVYGNWFNRPSERIDQGAVAGFGRSQRSSIPGGRGSCRALRFRGAVAQQEPRPPMLTIIRDCTLCEECTFCAETYRSQALLHVDNNITRSVLSNHDFGVARHSRGGGNPVFDALDSRLRGNDEPLFLALTVQ
jgi:hypothetical protein